MSISALIFVKAKPGWERCAHVFCTVEPLRAETADDPTHEIHVDQHLYAIDYERGNWPAIAAHLLSLMQDKEIEWVRYGHGHGDGLPPLMTPARLFEITAHWLQHGNRPYYEQLDRKQ